MVFWRKANEEEQPPPPLHEKIQTQFPNIVHHIGNWLTMPWNVKNHALSDAEIKSRMAGIPIYKLASTSNGDFGVSSRADPQRRLELHFVGEADALNYFEKMKLLVDWPPARDHWQIFDAPLSNVVVSKSEVRLVPESSQIKNAIEEKKKKFSDSNNFIRGVPVFKCDDFHVGVVSRGNKGFRPVYLRKEDLQNTITAWNILPSNIEVASLEEIIQEMKDSSTNKSNDIIFIGPGGSTYWH